MNEYDSARIADILHHSHGLELTNTPENADILLLNTCSIREKAQEKVFSQLGRWRVLKQNNPHVLIGVGGCVASQEGAAILRRAPFVDLVFGPQTIHRLPQLLNNAKTNLYTKTRRNSEIVDTAFTQIEKFDCLPNPTANGVTAFVTIMEGCSHFCTYCVVPYTRGPEVSRPVDDIIAESVELAQQGVKEITLLGQNVNAYQGLLHDGDSADLAFLIHYLAAIDGIERIRFTSSHPVAMSDSLIAAFANEPKLAPQLHLPVQSGSDRILALMQRGHTTATYLNIIERLRQACPHISLSSDFIVGFPGETDADFQATLDLVAKANFERAFSFIYSPRPGTKASEYLDTVPMSVKQQRLLQLQELLDTNAKTANTKLIGSIQTVLVENVSKNDPTQLIGRAANGLMVHFVGPRHSIGQSVEIRITEAFTKSLRGILL